MRNMIRFTTPLAENGGDEGDHDNDNVEVKLLMEMEDDSTLDAVPTSRSTVFCQVCRQNISKYKCPACCTLSCSLDCVNRHKSEQSCSGRSSPVQKVPINQFTSDTMRKDLIFLDQASALAERAARMTSRRFASRLFGQNGKFTGKGVVKTTTTTTSSGKRQLPVSLFRKKCDERGIRLKLCPAELSMRRNNSTQLTRKTKRLSWKIQWEFRKAKKILVDGK